MELTIKEAYKLCVQKWTALARYDYSIPIKDHFVDLMKETNPELANIKGWCGYCEFYRNECHAGCPLCIDGLTCHDKGHPFDDWRQTESKKAARKVLNLIKKQNQNGTNN